MGIFGVLVFPDSQFNFSSHLLKFLGTILTGQSYYGVIWIQKCNVSELIKKMHDCVIFENHKKAWEVWAPTLGGMGTYLKKELIDSLGNLL